MAAPSYTEDLTDIDLAETLTGWFAIGVPAGLTASPDLAMQGVNCVDKAVSSGNKGQGFNNGAPIVPGVNDHFFVWLFVATPGLTATIQNEGVVVMLGLDAANYNTFHVEGIDTYGAVGRAGRCYAVRYVTSGSAVPPYRTNYGTPPTNPQTFGGKLSTTGAVKGANFGVDALRYGTGAYITAGDVGTPGTFAGFAALDNAVANRWGILIGVGGVFELQGRFVVGQNDAKTPTAAYFDDSNIMVLLIDTVHSLGDFTQVIVDHASTVFNLTNVTFLALGTNNPGKLVFNNASTVSALALCTFDGMGEFVLRAGVTATGCTWRSCDKLTQNGATLAGCAISGATTGDGEAFIISDDPGLISGCAFTFSDGHAIEITTPGEYGMAGDVFSGYGADESNDAAIYNNSGGYVKLNISGGGNVPTVRNGGGASTDVVVTVVHKLTGMEQYSEVTYVRVSDSQVLFNVGDVDETGETEFSYGADKVGTVVDILIFHVEYLPVVIADYTLPATDVSIPISQVFDRVYENP